MTTSSQGGRLTLPSLPKPRSLPGAFVQFKFQEPQVRPSSTKRSVSIISDTGSIEFVDSTLLDDSYYANHNYERFLRKPSLTPITEKSRVQRCLGSYNYRRHQRNYFRACKHVTRYWRKVMILYETIHEELRFPILPEKAASLNHLSAQLWLVTFAMNELSEELAETSIINKLSELYAKVVYEAMKTEEFLRNFKEPLSTLVENGVEQFASMKLSIFGEGEVGNNTTKSVTPDSEVNNPIPIARTDSTNSKISLASAKVAATADGDALGPVMSTIGSKFYSFSIKNATNNNVKIELEKTMKETLLAGSRIQQLAYFTRLEIYTRTTAKRKWYLFSPMTWERKLQIVYDAVTNVTEALVRLRTLLRPVLQLLRNGSKPSCCCNMTLIKHLRQMATSLIVTASTSYEEYSSPTEEAKIITEIRRCEAYLHSIIYNGRQLISQILEVLAMSQLCYVHLVDGLEIPMPSCEDVITRLFKGKGKTLFRPNDFTPSDFYMTKYPDILRKIPIIVQRTELCLHKRTEHSLLNIAKKAKK